MTTENTDNSYKSRTDKRTNRTQPATMGLGKLPPQAIDLEEAVLGAIMIEKNALTSVIEFLKPQIFYKDSHQKIYNAIQQLFTKSQPIDILTVTAQLRQNGELELIGGAYTVTELTNRVASAANIEYHARILAQKFIQRELIRISTDVISNAYEDTTDVFQLLDQAEQNLFSIAESNLRKNAEGMSELIKKSIIQIESLKDKVDGLTGVPSGFSDLDRITSGWQNSDLVIIAARPGMGKTAFILSAVRNASVDFNIPTAVFSLEMSSVQLVNRMISGETELPSEKLRRGNLADYEWQQLHSKINKLVDAPIYIDDTPALNIFELRAKCRRLKAQYNIQMIVIDYLQLMHGQGDNRNGNREQEVGAISRALKALAKELNVPVIALSQLSRAPETRPGNSKRPQLSDLRESGSIEQDADMVIFLYRPEYYGLEVDEDNNNTRGIGEVIIAKHRNGSTGTVKLKFIPEFVKFKDLEPDFGSLNANPFAAINPNTDFESRPSDVIIRPSKMNDPDLDGDN